MDCVKEQKGIENQLTTEENVRISFACMVDNQKKLNRSYENTESM